MSIAKTLIGLNNVLFLNNDSSQELEVHCNNLLKIYDTTLSRYSFKNIMLFVFPNKSLIYKDYLPQPYIFKYRPALDIYKQKFKENIFDIYDVLKNETDVYYKTDTHINLKGGYIVYKFFIDTINSRLNINIQPKNITISTKTCALNTLPYGIGDLTWKTNLQDQQLDNIMDTFYFNEECFSFYLIYKITNDSIIRFLDYKLIDNTNNLVNKNVDWDIISKYIIYKKNTNKINMKVLIFYDSFLLNTIPLYLELFNELYLIKTVYSNELINLIQPNYVFEFRVERFLF